MQGAAVAMGDEEAPCEESPLMRAGKEGHLQLRLRTLEGTLVTVESNVDQLVRELKLEVARKLMINCSYQILAGNRFLQDWAKLGDYGEATSSGSELQLVLLTEPAPRFFQKFRVGQLEELCNDDRNLLEGYIPKGQWQKFARSANRVVENAGGWEAYLLRHTFLCIFTTVLFLATFLWTLTWPSLLSIPRFFQKGPRPPARTMLEEDPYMTLAVFYWLVMTCVLSFIIGLFMYALLVMWGYCGARRFTDKLKAQRPDCCDKCIDGFCWVMEDDTEDRVAAAVCSLARKHFHGSNVSFRHVPSEQVIMGDDRFVRLVRRAGFLEVECWCIFAPSLVSVGRSMADREASLE